MGDTLLGEKWAATKRTRQLIISNETLTSLTLFIASSKPEEVDVVKKACGERIK